ncbi:POX domain [Sesbania bispinosa]|nr:POX domain [Sesbania bispinosa]
MQTHLSNQIQGFVSTEAEMFNLSGTGMEMIGFPKQQQSEWKSFFSKPGPTSSSTMNESCSNFFQHQHEYTNTTAGISETGSQNLIVGDSSAAWQGENRSLVVEDSSLRCVFPCEGNERPSQGLSLSLSSNNPSSIGLQSFELRHHQPQSDFVSDGKSSSGNAQQQQMTLEDVYLSAKAAANLYHSGHFLLTNSKYLVPAQELLNEFCSLDARQSDDVAKQKLEKNKAQLEIDQDTSKKHSLTSLELAELHKRKIKLLSMLEEVERRYRHYRNQMKAVVSSFEAVAGNGAATVYSALALKAMSRHFRCLKDGIMGQIEVTRKGMGERDAAVGTSSRGETPRLKIIDQALRQQRAFQQMNMTETHPWRPQRGLPDRSVSILRAWLFDHFLNPVRLWKPMVEDMYLEEVKEQENNINCEDDQKPTVGLNNIDSECASINNQQHINAFSSSNTSSGGGVSLTLGLKQAPPSQSSVLYPIVREPGVVQYSLFDEEGLNPLQPYRNLMDAQLLHHLPG